MEKTMNNSVEFKPQDYLMMTVAFIIMNMITSLISTILPQVVIPSEYFTSVSIMSTTGLTSPDVLYKIFVQTLIERTVIIFVTIQFLSLVGIVFYGIKISKEGKME